jgi:hypothetical protein
MHNLSTTKLSEIVVVLDKSEIQSFNFVLTFVLGNEKLDCVYRVPAVGVQCYSCSPSTSGDDRKCDMFGITLEDGGIIVVNKSHDKVNVTYAKVKNPDEKFDLLNNCFRYKISHFMRTGLVLLGKFFVCVLFHLS